MLAVSICPTLSYLAENHVGQDKGGLLLRHRDAWESVLHHARRPDWEKGHGFHRTRCHVNNVGMDQYLLNPINTIFRGMNIHESQLF